MFSGLRIVLTATAITVALILCAFGAIGMLMMARTPQAPAVDRFDPVPPRVQQSDTEVNSQPAPETPTSVHEKTPPAEPEPDTADLEKKAVKTLRVIAPPAAPEQKAEEKTEIAGDPKNAAPAPETTGAIPPAASPQQQTAPRAERPRPHRPQNVRRPTKEAQSENPFLQLFGIKKYR